MNASSAGAAAPTAILLPLLVALGATICTIIIRAFAFNGIIHFVRRETRLGHVGAAVWKDVLIVMVSTILALVAHLVDIFVWALIFVWCGDVTSMPDAIYYSAGNYTSMGGGIAGSPSWKLLAPLETADGLLMFGVSTAMLFAVIQRLIQSRFQREEQSAAAG